MSLFSLRAIERELSRRELNSMIDAAQRRIAELEARLASADKWREAIDQALIVACIGTAEPHDDPKERLAKLIDWETKIALDPAVSSEARALIARGQNCARSTAAEDTLRRLGYTYHGGELWVPPIGPRPEWAR